MNFEYFNMALLEIEEKLRCGKDEEIEYPFYFVIGAPRSGTTLLTQLLAYCFDFGYITNLAARFWLNPVLGIQFSKEMLGNGVKPSFQSKYANTQSLGDIHEFGKFWMSHLGFSSSQDVDWMVPDEESASLTLQALRAIQSEFHKPVVMKGIYPAYCYEWINEQLGDKAVWINIWRDPLDACVSILEARKKKMRDFSAWFGWQIPKSDRDLVYDVGPCWQVGYQVKYFQGVYSGLIGDKHINLKALCDNAEFQLNGICDWGMKHKPPELEYHHYDRFEEKAWFKTILAAI